MREHRKSTGLWHAVELAAWGAAAVGYFGPWISHPSSALAWNAFDLFDILRILPDIETLTLQVNLYTLRLPLVGLAILLAFLLTEARPLVRGVAALVSAAFLINTLPPYDVIRTAWNTPGWRVPFWWGVSGLAALAFLTGWDLTRNRAFRRRTAMGGWLALSWTLLTFLPAFITFPRLIPALERLYAAPVSPGWGFWVCGAGAITLTISLWMRTLGTRPASQSGATSTADRP